MWSKATLPMTVTPTDTLLCCELHRITMAINADMLPVRAFIIVPSVVFHSALGKLMFCCADLAIGWLLVKILVARGISKQRAVLYSCAWLFNPISINISTRGNCDSLISLLVIATLYLLMKQRIKLAAVL